MTTTRMLSILSALALVLILLPGLAAAQPEDDVAAVTPARVDGATRYHTAAALATLTFDEADVVHLVDGEDFADALSATFGAGAVDGPVLLVPPGGIDEAHPTSEALRELGAERVVLVGGENAISSGVEDWLEAQGYATERIAGPDRYATAAAVAVRYGAAGGAGVGELEGDRTALLASGQTFADALTAGPVAARSGLPLLLTPADRAHDSVAEALDALDIERIVLVGGTNAIDSSLVGEYRERGYVVERWAGATRTETATVVADNAHQRLGFDVALTVLARGDGFADALAAGVHAGVNAAPILLTENPTTLGQPTRAWLQGACPDVEVVRAVGGPAAIAIDTLAEAVDAAGACDVALGATCTNPEDDYTVDHPADWATNAEPVGEVPPCSMFDPDPDAIRAEGNDIPANLAVYLRVQPVAFDDAVGPDEGEEVLSRRDTIVDGRAAERLEVHATGDGEFPAGTLTTRWAIDLGDATLYAISRSAGEPAYETKVEVLDAMVASLRVGGDRAWRALPDAPIDSRINHTATWTGEEMLIWGGGDLTGVHADGAAWNPTEQRWRPLPTAPIQARWQHEASWTGEELLVWGGNEGADHLAECFADGAAYDPVDDTWRPLPPAPGDGRCGASSVWTGEALMIVGGHSASGPPAPADFAADAILYSPATDTWRSTPPAPIAPRISAITAWTGTSVLVHAGLDADLTPQADGAAYDPDTDTWRGIADSPLTPRSGMSGTWMDDALLVVGGRDDTTDSPATDAAIYDPATDTWRTVAGLPAGHTERAPLVWGGRAAHIVGGDTRREDGPPQDIPSFHSYRPDHDGWIDQPSPPESPRTFHTLVWAEDRLILWGGDAHPDGLPAGGAWWSPAFP